MLPLVGKEGLPQGNPSKGFPLVFFASFLTSERMGLRGLSAKENRWDGEKTETYGSVPLPAGESNMRYQMLDVRHQKMSICTDKREHKTKTAYTLLAADLISKL